MKTNLIKLSDIKVNPNNPRVIKDDKYQKLVNSIKEFPKMLQIRPIVVNDDMIVLGGNMRLKACKEAGLKEVPVIKASDLTEEEQRRFIIADNVGFGEWDWQMIQNEWDTEQVAEWGLDIPDFVNKLTAEEDDFEVPPIDEIKTDIVLGDLFEIGRHKLICGDATNENDWLKLQIPSGFATFTSPPYNVGKNATLVGNTHSAARGSLYNHNEDFELNYDELLSKSTKNAIDFTEGVAFNVQPLANNKVQLLLWISSFAENFNDILTWNKSQAAPAMAKGVCSSAYEWIVIFSQKKTRTIPLSSWRGSVSNVYNAPPQRNNDFSEHHGATFPIHLPNFIMSELMNISKGVVDCFMGTGTTMVAAHQLGRIGYGIEISPQYCEIILQRMITLDPSLKVLRNGKEYVKTGLKQGLEHA